MDEKMQAEVAKQVAAALGQMQGMIPSGGAQSQAGGFIGQNNMGSGLMPQQSAQNTAGSVNPVGFSVPVETDINGMTVTIYVQFPANLFPQYQQVIMTLLNYGYNVRGFQRSQGGWGNNGGGYYRGGYSRGGYGRGGYGR